MAKKLQAKDEDQQLTEAVRSSAQQIWQAGLGAFAKAQEEGGRVFSRLVKDGTDLQKRTRSKAEEKVADVRETVSGLADDIGSKASGSWDKLEQVFEERVLRALSSIGVPTRKDIDALVQRLDQLSKAVAELSGGAAAPAASAAKPVGKGAPKAAVKKVPVRKAATKATAKAVATPVAAAPSTAKPAAVKSVAKKTPAKAAAKSVAKPAAKKATKRATTAAD